MNDFEKAFLFERRKICKEKNFLFSFIIFLLLATTFLLVFRTNMTGHQGEGIGRGPSLEEQRDFYLENYEGRYEYGWQPGEWVIFTPFNDPEFKDFYYQQYKLYDFYLETNTTSSDYIDTQELSSNKGSHSKTLRTLYVAKLSYWIFFASALLLAGYYFLSDAAKGKNKIIFASKLNRKDIFNSKLCMSFLCFGIVFFVCFLIGILPYGSANTLYYNGSSYIAINCFWVYVANMLHHAATFVLIFALALYVGAKTKSRTKAIATPLSAFGLSFGLTWMLWSCIDDYITKYGFWQPLSNTYFGTGDLWQPQFWVIFALTLIAAVFLLIFAKKEYMKGDIC